MMKEAFNLLRSKKIMTEVFPKLGGLPQPVIDQMLEKANDGMLLYSPTQKIGEEKSGVYYCLRCGSHGEIIGENIVCLKCCNHNVRSFQNDSYRSKFKGNCRYVHLVDEYVVMQDFYWCVEEKPEKGQYVNLSEMSRFIIAEDDFILYDANFRYPYGGRDDREVTWTQRKKPSTRLDLLTLNAMVASNSVLIPVEAHVFSADGLNQVVKMVDVVKRRLNSEIYIEGMIITKYQQNTNCCRSIFEFVDKEFGSTIKIFKDKIKYAIKLADVPAFGISIHEYAPKSEVAISYANIAKEVLRNA